MNMAVSFSGRKDGNCDRIARYISAEDDLVFFMREISTRPCADCNYECMWGRCRYRGDGIYSCFDKLSTVDRIFYIVPMYCGNPSALYFILNERCQDYFLHNESQYEEIVEKLYIIGVYGSSEDSPDFLDFFARQYDFRNPGKHILGLERHRYHQKMGDFLLEEEEVRARLDAFTGRIPHCDHCVDDR